MIRIASMLLCASLLMLVPSICADSVYEEELVVTDHNMLLLQTYARIEPGRPMPKAKRGDTQNHTANTEYHYDMALPLLQADVKTESAGFHLLGQMPAYHKLHQQSQLAISRLNATQNSLPEQPKPYTKIILVGYGIVAVMVILLMYRSVQGQSHLAQTPKWESSTRRPEMEAWERGLMSWFSLSWVSTWMVQWGSSSSFVSMNQIRSEDLGALASVDDEAERNRAKFEQIWEESRRTCRLSGKPVSLMSVMVQFLTLRKIAFLLVTGMIFEWIMYLTPPFAINYANNFMIEVYIA
jgi:hypothetical protein